MTADAVKLDVADAIAAMVARTQPVGSESVPLHAAADRVLAAALITDRPSPACDVSAMDGYGLRLADRHRDPLPVAAEVGIGHAPPDMPPHAAVRIFTGGPVPSGCEAVIPREHVHELPDAIRIPSDLAINPGQHIRRRGENSAADQSVVDAGSPITPTVAAALAAVGCAQPAVHRRVRLAVIVTGNEVHDIAAAVDPWQLRDSNGPALQTLFAPLPWIDLLDITHVSDDPSALRRAVAGALDRCDAMLLTGGVSMGDYDFVPRVLTELGADTVFHKLPIRPGKPILAAITPAGQPVLGLPGNPVSVMTTARRIAAPILRRLAGFALPDSPPLHVVVANPDTQQLPLRWSRPARLVAPGTVELLPSRGSGDIIAAARSDGFVELPPQQHGPGPWPFYPWTLQP